MTTETHSYSSGTKLVAGIIGFVVAVTAVALVANYFSQGTPPTDADLIEIAREGVADRTDEAAEQIASFVLQDKGLLVWAAGEMIERQINQRVEWQYTVIPECRDPYMVEALGPRPVRCQRALGRRQASPGLGAL